MMGATTAVAPARSLEQRNSALERSRTVRSVAREFKDRLADLSRPDAHREVAHTLVADPGRIATIKLHVLLGSIPGVGDAVVRRMIRRLDIWPLKQVRELTLRQRVAVAAELRCRAEQIEASARPAGAARGGCVPSGPLIQWLRQVAAAEGNLAGLSRDAGLHEEGLARVARRGTRVRERTARAALRARGLDLEDVYSAGERS